MAVTDPSNPPRLTRGLRWLLIGSLAFNVLVVGSVAGLGLRHLGGGEGPPSMSEGRPAGFGPWTGGLTRDDHRALRKAFDAEGFDFRADFRAEREDRSRLLASLRAEPFDPAALRRVIDSMEARGAARMALSNRLTIDYLVGLAPEARKAVADRMEASAKADRAGRRDKGHDDRGRDDKGRDDRGREGPRPPHDGPPGPHGGQD